MKNSTMRLTSQQLMRLPEVLSSMEDELPEGWVFGGVMRRADAPFMTSDDKSLWVAIAVLEHPTELGPVPEARGVGADIVAAVRDLRQHLIDVEISQDRMEQQTNR